MKIAGVLLAGLVCLATAAYSQEITWPQELIGDEGAAVLIYQPQVEAFTGNNLEARAAVSVKTASSGGVADFDAVWIKAKLDTNRDTRTAEIRDIEISAVLKKRRPACLPSKVFSGVGVILSMHNRVWYPCASGGDIHASANNKNIGPGNRARGLPAAINRH